jgi:pteridine reductase
MSAIRISAKAGAGRKVALVTGSAVRVGRAIALELATAGYDLVLHYRSSSASAEQLAREVRALGVRAAEMKANLTKSGEVPRLIDRALRAMGRIDVLVGSAANFLRVPFSKTTALVWDEAMNLNARANFLLARAAEAELRRRRGRIVLISDLAAHRVWKDYSAHAVSKAAVEMVVRVLARQLAPEVSVNGIAPGTILPPESMPKSETDRILAQIPMQRFGTPQEIAQTVRFFCEGPAFITGQVLIVDGGRSLF